jgi:hypothetical protein
MEYICEQIEEPLILEPEDYPGDEWSIILKIFGMEEAERIVISNYKFEAYGKCEVIITEEQWGEAIEHLNTYIIEYANIGWAGQAGLYGVLVPLKKRFENGERTRKLYDEIMSVE